MLDSFRGSNGTGVFSTDMQKGVVLPASWDFETGENIVWKSELPLPGVSSPVIWGDRLFLTGGSVEKQEIYCFNRKTGKMLWKSSVPQKNFDRGFKADELMINDDTGFAAPSPVLDDKRVFVTYATGDVAAFTHDGKQLWVKNVGKSDSAYGPSSSPVLHENILIMQYDQGDENNFLIGLDVESGKEVYRIERQVENSWSSPLLIKTDKRAELILVSDPGVKGYDPATGKELWNIDGVGGEVGPMATYANGLIYAVNTGSVMQAIKPRGEGDVSETHVVWSVEENLPDTSSPLSDGKY